MPNPFVRLGTPNQSDSGMARDAERPPPALQPVPEVYDGSNHPYRGTEPHGVADTGQPYEVPGWEGGTRPVEYDPPVRESDPVPVRIVSENARERKLWRTRQEIVQPLGVPRPLVGANENRTTVKIKNVHATLLLWVSQDQNVSTFTGYSLAAGAELELDTEDEIWAINVDATNAVPVAILEEYTVKI